MKYQFFTLQVIFLLIACYSNPAAAQSERPRPANRAKNASFEEGAEHWNLKSAKVVSAEARSGKSSLFYSRSNPKQYELVTQGNFEVEPGQVVRFSAFVKGKDVKTANLYALKGAGIYLQGYDAKGKYINGAFPFCKTGTFDWSKVEGMYEVPANVVRITLGVYMREGTTGNAWFDDLTMEVADEAVFNAFLAYPNYRGIAPQDENGPWEACVKYNLPAGWDDTRVESELQDGNNKTIFTETRDLQGRTGEQSLFFAETGNLPAGDYQWKLTLTDGENELEKILPVQVSNDRPDVYIDEDGFTVQNGERIFPFGVYLGSSPGKGSWASSKENLELIRDAGFNTILSYYFGDKEIAAGYVKQAAGKDLNVIYSLKDVYDGSASNPRLDASSEEIVSRLVNELKDAPNLLAWYTNDEMGLGEVPAVEQMYELLRQKDPDHPVYQVNNKLNVLKWYFPSTDILGTDPYPVTDKVNSLAPVATWTKATMDASGGAKAVWQVLQVHNKSYHKKNMLDREPTLDEMRNMSYLALIKGAKGLMYYAYHWLWYGRDGSGKAIKSEKDFQRRWPNVQKMSREVSQILPVILKDEKVTLNASRSDAIRYQAWQDGEKLYLMIANPEPEADKIALEVPQGYGLADNAISGIETTSGEGELQVEMAPLASGVLVLER